MPTVTMTILDFLVIINPRARRAGRVDRAALAAPWSARGVTEVVLSASRDHAAALCEQAVTAGAKAIIVVGGDGSANAAAGQLLGSNTALAVVGAGTTNVFARSIGVPRDPLAASASLAQGWAAGRRHLIPVGRANKAVFLANAGVGLDAAVVRRVEAAPRAKRFSGHGWFLAAALLESGGARRPNLSVGIVPEAGEAIGPTATSFLAALRTGPYTFIGPRPLHLSPGSDLRRGLHAVQLAPRDRWALARAAAAALTANGPSSALVARHDSVKVIDITAAEPAPYQVDGEFVGTCLHLRIELHPDRLWLLRPS